MRREYNSISSGVLPAGYAECEYIESTGTQYISTNIIGRSGLSVETELANMEDYDDKIALGSRTSSGSRFMLLAMNKRNSSYTHQTINYGYDSYKYTEFQLNIGTFYKIKVELNVGYQLVEVNGDIVYQGSESVSVNNGFPLFIFCCNNNGNPMYFAQAKMKRTLIKYNETIPLSLIPALRLSDNKPGMYDLCGSICSLTGTPFYVNAGTGEFLYQLKN